MQVIFDATLFFQYGFCFLSTHDASSGEVPELGMTRGGQANGLLGAAVPGVLSFKTATHTGDVRVRIEAHDAAPVLVDAADEVVEASFEAFGADAWLQTFDDGGELTLPGPGSYRVRLSCFDWDAGDDGSGYDGPAPDRYLLQLWPAEAAPDAVLRQRSERAGYWHGVAATTPAPGPEELTRRGWEDDEDDEDDATREAFWQQERLREQWGGTVPGEPLLSLGGYTAQLHARDSSLVEALAAAGAAHQRAVALWAARRVCAAASDRLDWSVALDAVAAGRPVPAPFDDFGAVSAIAWPPDPDAPVGQAQWSMSVGRAVRSVIDPTVSAVSALRGTTEPDPLRAAVDAVEAAGWSERDEKAFFAAVRAELARLTG